jgi:ATP synthase protein I
MGDDPSPSKSGPSKPGDHADGSRQRLDDLDSRLRVARKGPEVKRRTTGQREMSFAYRVLVEMIAGLGFGAFVGWWLDEWLGTRPILMVVMILLGFAAGALNAYRVSQAYTAGANDDRQDRD